MSPRASILWVDADGHLLGSWPGQEPPPTTAVMVVAADGHEPAPEVLASLARAPGRSGVDALCQVAAVVDALVEVDRAGLVAGHLDRERHVRAAMPQVVVASWWPRLARTVAARVGAGVPPDPAGLVADLGGRVVPLRESAIDTG